MNSSHRMSARNLSRLLLAILFLTPVLHAQTPPASQTLESAFAAPPAEARPWVYWFWMNGNITREGITADLEAMKRVGIGGVLIQEVNPAMPAGPVHFGSPQWYEMFQFAASEADRLGLQINMTNDAGWCGSGGPWITPELSMQFVVTSEVQAKGETHFAAALPQPETRCGFYRDIAVLAFPTLPIEEVKMTAFAPKVTASAPGFDGAKILDGRGDNLPVATKDKPQYVQFEFAQPFETRSVYLDLGPETETSGEAEIEISDDGTAFRSVRHINLYSRAGPLCYEIKAVSSRFYRILFTHSTTRIGVFPIMKAGLLAAPRIDCYRSKADYGGRSYDKIPGLPSISKEMAVPAGQIRDITSRLDSHGHLDWNVPAGNWTLLRVGYTSTGAINHPAPEGGLGLECDKLSREAIEVQFAGLMAKIVSRVGPLAGMGKTLVATHVDSAEMGMENWTPKFREEFRARRGYDLLHFFPVLTGRIVDNVDVSERFLWDLRQTVSDLMAENYVGHLEELAQQRGLKLTLEAYGDSPTDDLLYGSRADEPQGEFWWYPSYANADKVLDMASVAHVYGKPILGAESFTSDSPERWRAYPGNMKAEGDWALSMGVNRFVFHRYAMQPWLDRKPGMTMGPFGVHYERTQTWWEQSVPWHQYLARCQYMLRQGLPVNDICYLEPEGSPQEFGQRPHDRDPIPEHTPYGFDGAPAEAVFKRFSVQNGNIVLPDGMTYRVLVLADGTTMTPALLGRVKQLVADGATVVGPRPLTSPSADNYPACDTEVKAMDAELWGDCDGKTVKEHVFGKGRIIWGKTPEEVLANRGVPPDFSDQASTSKSTLRYTHRRSGDTDIYFVANPRSDAMQTMADFRVQGKRPQFWWPETGRIEDIAVYQEANGITKIPLRLDATQSVFVIFRPNQRTADPVVSISLDGQSVLPPEPVIVSPPIVAVASSADFHLTPDGKLQLEAWKPGAYTITTKAGKTLIASVPALPPPVEIVGPWELSFPAGGGAPPQAKFARLVPWNSSDDFGIKYFSGTATYRKSMQVPAEMVGPGRRVYLDLGTVQVIAQIKLNGKNLGIFWKAPYRAEITDAVKAGDNSLEVAVTNLWPNRLIGDEQLPGDSELASDRNGDGSPKLWPDWFGTGTLKAWPQWMLDGKSSPTGRVAFTAWRLWKKKDPLLDSGWLGPVSLRSALDVTISEH